MYSPTPPSNSQWIINWEFAKQELEAGDGVHLCEEICNLLRGGDVRKGEYAIKVVMANEVTTNLNVLRTLVENWIDSNLDGTPIDAVKRGGSSDKHTGLPVVVEGTQFSEKWKT